MVVVVAHHVHLPSRFTRVYDVYELHNPTIADIQLTRSRLSKPPCVAEITVVHSSRFASRVLYIELLVLTVAMTGQPEGLGGVLQLIQWLRAFIIRADIGQALRNAVVAMVIVTLCLIARARGRRAHKR